MWGVLEADAVLATGAQGVGGAGGVAVGAVAALVDLVCVWCAKWCYGGGCGAHRAMRKQLPEMHIA